MEGSGTLMATSYGSIRLQPRVACRSTRCEQVYSSPCPKSRRLPEFISLGHADNDMWPHRRFKDQEEDMDGPTTISLGRTFPQAVAQAKEESEYELMIANCGSKGAGDLTFDNVV